MLYLFYFYILMFLDVFYTRFIHSYSTTFTFNFNTFTSDSRIVSPLIYALVTYSYGIISIFWNFQGIDSIAVLFHDHMNISFDVFVFWHYFCIISEIALNNRIDFTKTITSNFEIIFQISKSHASFMDCIFNSI